jgi:hypothetical protein
MASRYPKACRSIASSCFAVDASGRSVSRYCKRLFQHRRHANESSHFSHGRPDIRPNIECICWTCRQQMRWPCYSDVSASTEPGLSHVLFTVVVCACSVYLSKVTWTSEGVRPTTMPHRIRCCWPPVQVQSPAFPPADVHSVVDVHSVMRMLYCGITMSVW